MWCVNRIQAFFFWCWKLLESSENTTSVFSPCWLEEFQRIKLIILLWLNLFLCSIFIRSWLAALVSTVSLFVFCCCAHDAIQSPLCFTWRLCSRLNREGEEKELIGRRKIIFRAIPTSRMRWLNFRILTFALASPPLFLLIRQENSFVTQRTAACARPIRILTCCLQYTLSSHHYNFSIVVNTFQYSYF